MSKRLISTCDRCKRDEPTLTFRVEGHLSVNASANGAPASFDLCDGCSGDLKHFLGDPAYVRSA